MDDNKIFSSDDVAKLTGMSIRAVQAWAYANDVPSAGNGKRKIYLWRQKDIDEFKQRPPPWRPKK